MQAMALFFAGHAFNAAALVLCDHYLLQQTAEPVQNAF